MKIRQTIKKVAAVAIGSTMLGATLMGAMAANLSEYPQPFVKNGQFSGQIVIGEKAATQDVLGAVDIAASLQAVSYTETTVSCAGTGISVTGGKTEEVTLNSTLATDFGTIDNNDIPSLLDSKISWNDEELDVEEKITVDNVKVMTSDEDEDFGQDIVLGTAATSAIQYKVVIEDSDFKDALVTEDEPIKIDFLGKAIEITDVNAAANEITLSVANEHYMSVGDKVVIDGKTVTLKNVGDAVISVDVDGITKLVNNGNSEKVNGITVDVTGVFYVDDVAQRAATVKLGNKITDTITDDESMELFGEPSQKSQAQWVWEVAVVTNSSLTIGANHNQKYDTDAEPVKKVGEAFTLPNNYATVELNSLTVAADKSIKIYFDDSVSVDKNESGVTISTSDASFDDEKALVFEASEKLFKVNVLGSVEDTDTIYLIQNSTNQWFQAYVDKDGNTKLFDIKAFSNSTTTESFDIEYDNTILNVTATGVSASLGYTKIVVTGEAESALLGDAVLTLPTVDIAGQMFGTTKDEDDAAVNEIENNEYGVMDGKENDVRTSYGIVIEAPEDGVKSDEFMIWLPPETIKANVIVKMADSTVSGSAGGTGKSQVIVPIEVGVAVLDKDASMTANQIVVGGPCANTVAADLMGTTDPAACNEGFAQGTAKIKLFESGSKVSILVAGGSAADTQRASRVLANYKDYSLAGTEKTVTGTSLTDITVN